MRKILNDKKGLVIKNVYMNKQMTKTFGLC